MSVSLSPVSSGSGSASFAGCLAFAKDLLMPSSESTSAGAANMALQPHRTGSPYAVLRFSDEQATANTRMQVVPGGIDLTNSGGVTLTLRLAEITRVLSRIESFRQLPDDWAGDDTVLVASETSKIAERFLHELPEDVPVPQATPSADGEIGLIWFRNGKRFEVIIQPDRHVLWMTGQLHDYVLGDMINLNELSSLFNLNEALHRFLHG